MAAAITGRKLFEAVMKALSSSVKWGAIEADDRETYQEKADHANREHQTLDEAVRLIRRELGG